MKKVLIITYYWPPSGGAGVQRWVKFVKYLKATGIEPFVLTVHPDFATYPQTDPTLSNDLPEDARIFYARSFELYALYKKVSSNKEVPYGGFANTQKLDFKEKIIRFIRGNFIIPDPRKGWNRYAFRKAKELIRLYRIDTIITTSPPHSTQLIGRKLRQRLKVKWVADLRDPWTDIYYFRQMYPTFVATSIHRRLERKVLTGADRIITVSPALKALFSKKAPGIDQKTEVIPNGFDPADFREYTSTTSPGKFYISYVGTLSNEYNLKGFIKALQELPATVMSKITVRFTGKMPAELVEQFRVAGLSALLEITGYVPHQQAIEYLFSSDVLLLVIPDVKNNEGILTGKLFEYLASGKPILLIGPPGGDAANVLRETGNSLVCGYLDHSAMSNGLIRWFERKTSEKANSTPEGILNYSRQNLTQRLAALLESM